MELEKEVKELEKRPKHRIAKGLMAAGGLAAMLTCGTMVYDEARNIPGDGIQPCNGFTAVVLGEERYKECHLTRDCVYEHGIQQHCGEEYWECGPAKLEGVEEGEALTYSQKAAKNAGPGAEFVFAAWLVAFGAHLILDKQRRQRWRELKKRKEEKTGD